MSKTTKRDEMIGKIGEEIANIQRSINLIDKQIENLSAERSQYEGMIAGMKCSIDQIKSVQLRTDTNDNGKETE